MSDLAIRAEQVGYAVGGKSLVENVSFDVGGGEFVGVIGPNGAGKSTLLRLLAGDIVPGSGVVEVLGAPVVGVPPRELALRRAMLGANPPSDVPFTARTVVAAGRNPHIGLEGNTDLIDRQKVDMAMEATGVSELASRSYQTLSSGEQARVLVARLLAQESPVAMFDEPTASLDVANAESVLKALAVETRRGGTVLCAIHDLNAAAYHCDRLVLLDGGRVAADGAPSEVLDDVLLTRVYGHAIRVVPHPFRACPLVLVD